MPEFLVIRLPADADAPAQWIAVDSEGTRIGPPVSGPLAEATRDVRDRRVLALVPGADVLTTSVDIPLKGSKLEAALPFALEETVAEDIDELHFAAGARRGNGRVPVAVVNRERLDTWLLRLRDAGIEAARVLPEQYGLAQVPGTVSLLLEDDLLIVNDGDATELSLQHLTPGDALAAIGVLDAEGTGDDSSDGDAGATHVLVYCDSANDERYRHDWHALRHELASVDVKLLPDGALPRLATTVATGQGVNLLQGDYGPKTGYRNLLAPWKHAAMLLLGVLLIGTATKAVNVAALGRDEAALRERFHAEYRQLVPGAPDVADPVGIVQSLQSRAGGGNDEPQVMLEALEQLGRAVMANEDANIEAISFRAGVADVRLNATNVSVLDDIRQRIEQNGGFSARIQATDQVGDRVSSRLQIRAEES